MSLLMQLMRDPFFSNKQVLIVDSSLKDKNDRTWCFWEKESGIFEPIVIQQWQQLEFFAAAFSSQLKISPYRYKMIRGIDFYNHVLQAAKNCGNIHFHIGHVSAVNNEGDKGFAVIDGKKVYASYVFNSIVFDAPEFYSSLARSKKCFLLLQHFKGWLVETQEPCFDVQKARFMDFRISQQKGTAFMYVLPLSNTKALVEYTLFTPEVLEQEVYDKELANYINRYITTETYEVRESEYGVIPMTDHVFPQQNGRIIYIGTAGGQTKPSSGFTFRFIQKQSVQLAQALRQEKPLSLYSSFADKKFRLYDSILLRVLSSNKMGGDAIFARLFQKNTARKILSFLDNETSIWEDAGIIASMPSRIFLPAAWREIRKRLR